MTTHCFVLKPKVVTRGRAPTGTYYYPGDTVAINNVTIGSTSAALPGMTIRVGNGPGMDNLGRVRVKRQGSGGVIDVGRYSQGRRDGELDIAGGEWIDVLDLHGVWAKIPRIDKTTNDGAGYFSQYKDGDNPYGGILAHPTEGDARNPPPHRQCWARSVRHHQCHYRQNHREPVRDQQSAI